MPYERFRDFLHHISCKSTKKINDDASLGNNNRPHQAGLNNNQMLHNLFVCVAT
jgi:hypothetical protein